MLETNVARWIHAGKDENDNILFVAKNASVDAYTIDRLQGNGGERVVAGR